MRRVLKAIGLVAITIGTLSVIALTSLDAWKWRMFVASSGQEAISMSTADPSPALSQLVSDYVMALLICCAAGAVWAAAIVLPAVVAARWLLSSALANRLLAGAVVFVASALAFASRQIPNEFLPATVVFLVGGAIGLVGTCVGMWVLPPNVPLERTHER